MTGSVCLLATDALACLAIECSLARDRLRGALGACVVRVELCDEAFELRAGEIAPPRLDADVVVRSDVRTLHGVLEGEIDLADAVLDDRLRVVGGPSEVVAVATAMAAFVDGMLRCESMLPLRDRLAQLARGEGT
jgi:hypothetical protein